MKKILLLTLVLCIFFIAKSQNVLTTESILSGACKQAAKENKNIFVIFHASWCGWCKKMDASMNDATTKKYFDNNFVTVHLTVLESEENKKLENPGAAEFMKKLKPQAGSLPFFAILNNSRNVLADSFANGENLGCPASETEVAAFITLLKKTSKINDKELEVIAARFKQNKPQQ